MYLSIFIYLSLSHRKQQARYPPSSDLREMTVLILSWYFMYLADTILQSFLYLCHSENSWISVISVISLWLIYHVSFADLLWRTCGERHEAQSTASTPLNTNSQSELTKTELSVPKTAQCLARAGRVSFLPINACSLTQSSEFCVKQCCIHVSSLSAKRVVDKLYSCMPTLNTIIGTSSENNYCRTHVGRL